jgi:hypothetical protein
MLKGMCRRYYDEIDSVEKKFKVEKLKFIDNKIRMEL